MLGREVKILRNEFMSAGNYDISFNGSDLPSGTYICKAVSEGKSSAIKIVLVK
jgi:hypothetical protein